MKVIGKEERSVQWWSLLPAIDTSRCHMNQC